MEKLEKLPWPWLKPTSLMFVFLDDSTVDVINGLDEARDVYEAIDIFNEEFEFFDARGHLLQPRFVRPTKKRFLFFSWVDPGEYEFVLVPNADQKRIFTRLRKAALLNPNPWFENFGQIERFLRGTDNPTDKSTTTSS